VGGDLTVSKSAHGLRITDVERTVLDVPFRARSRPWNELLVGQWGVVEICRVTTNSPDIVGYGETVLEYTWTQVTDESVGRVIGRNPSELLADDSLGAGLQMALYDIVGKALGVPMYRLLGAPPVRDACPISWWNTKMPPEVLAEEAQDAVAEGYLAHKFKARPWFDVYEQVEAISAVTPQNYKVDIDWNTMLVSAGEATQVLRALDGYERVGIFEDAIGRMDVAGQRFLRDRVGHPTATHFNPVMFPTWIKEDAVDGFVVDAGGVSRFIQDGQTCAAFNKEFWLQIVGTGLTTAYTLHLGAVLTHARWPAVTALNIYADDLIVDPIVIEGGAGRVPQGPGLGVEVDESAIGKYRVESGYRARYPRKLLTVSFTDGRYFEYADMLQLWWNCLNSSTLPRQERGARLSFRVDDGSNEFDSLYRRAAARPGYDVPLPP
jgi:L-alanine-DL-glutamate epimerase-like enolase superfamily enzyme